MLDIPHHPNVYARHILSYRNSHSAFSFSTSLFFFFSLVFSIYNPNTFFSYWLTSSWKLWPTQHKIEEIFQIFAFSYFPQKVDTSICCWLLTVHCSLFIIHYPLSIIYYLLSIIHCPFSIVHCSFLSIVGLNCPFFSILVHCGLWIVDCGLWIVDCWLLIVPALFLAPRSLFTWILCPALSNQHMSCHTPSWVKTEGKAIFLNHLTYFSMLRDSALCGMLTLFYVLLSLYLSRYFQILK